MPDGLTLKQRKFAAEYVKRNGNGTQAALAAGYANGKPNVAAVQAHDNLKNPKIRRHIEKLANRWDLSAERVLARLDNLSDRAEQEGNFGAAVKAEELIGKSLGMWVERSLNVTVDMTDAHLQALRDLAARGKGQAKVIEGQSRAADNLLDSVQQQMGEGLGLPARSLTTQRGRATAGVSGAAGEPASVPYNMHYGKRD